MPSVLELAVIANKIYLPDVTSIGPWNRIDFSGSDQWGFYAGVFLHNNGNDAVIVFRGTDDIADGVEDLGIFLGRYPSQGVQASAILATWRSRFGRNRRIFLTGHSLGGGLASLMAHAYDLPCVSFNAPGMARSSVPSWVPRGIASVIATGNAVFRADPDILHIRAYFDAVSIGTGPRIGRVHSLPVSCAAPQEGSASSFLSAVFPGYAVVRSLVNAGSFVYCQHSMDNVVAALRGNNLYTQEIDFSRF